MSGNNKNLRIQIWLPPGRVVWNNFFEPRELDSMNKKTGKPDLDYGCTLILNKPDDPNGLLARPSNKALWDQMMEAAQKCKESFFTNGVPDNYDGPIKDGSAYNRNQKAIGKPEYPFLEGKLFMNLKSKNMEVGVANGIPDLKPKPLKDQKEIYDGCYILADGAFYAYNNKSIGMRFGLNSVMKIADGEPIVGMRNPELAFKDAKGKIDITGLMPDNSQLLNQDRQAVASIDI